MSNGMIFAFSGLDGSGKSTQMNLIIDKLEEKDYPLKYRYIRFGSTKRVEKIKNILQKENQSDLNFNENQIDSDNEEKKNSFFRRIYLLFAYLDLIFEFIIIRIEKKLGYVLICDRYYWDCFVIFQYKEVFNSFDKYMWRLIKKIAKEPNRQFYFKISTEEAYQRILKRKIDFESLSRLTERNKLYNNIESDINGLIIDAEEPIEQISAIIWENIEEFV